MIKCIAIDMDGTLLNKDHQISEVNISAIKKAQGQGIEVVIATGRSYPEAIYILKEAGIICPVICTNGAEVRSTKGEIIEYRPLHKEVVGQVVKVLDENDIYVEFFTSKGIYSANMDQGISIFKNYAAKAHGEELEDKLESLLQERMEFITEVENFDFIFEDSDHHIYKLLAFSIEGQRLNDAQQDLGKIDGIAVSSSGINNLEINSVEAQKGLALETFTKQKGISLMDTMAIGDNYNDVSMFQRVGRAVAMGNADEVVKSKCHFVTATNEESGVGKAILEAIE